MAQENPRYRRVTDDSVSSTVVGDESVAWNSVARKVSMLNETATYILGNCDGQTQESIVALLTEAYAVSAVDARPHVAECLATLVRLGLVRRDCDEGAAGAG